MQTRLIVAVVGRDLERLADRAAEGHQPLEGPEPVAAPRPLDEIVALRLQEAFCELQGDGAVALEQTIGNSAVRRHSSRPTRGWRSMPRPFMSKRDRLPGCPRAGGVPSRQFRSISVEQWLTRAT